MTFRSARNAITLALGAPMSSAGSVRVLDGRGRTLAAAKLPAGAVSHSIRLGHVAAGVFVVVAKQGRNELARKTLLAW
ncbi:MAG: hypothetical protein GF418_12495 [Chitinivibrionales bacterium]|nr:hypothetical protein [Chitinivibrionales bacterium]MBD3396438.1 hypothetical protein [Chitinivibrionales bacterium]